MTVEGSTSNFYNHWQGRVPPPTPSLWEQFKDALTSNQNFEYLYWIQVGMSVAFDYTMRLLGPCLIVLALGLLSSVTYLYFLVLLPLLLGPQVGPAHVLHGAFALLLLVNVFFNYLLCVSTSPGSPRQPCDPQTADLMEANRQGGLTMDPRSWSYCKKCRVPRPPRAHHCHVCKKCVLNMDHHCPWVSNCVGYYNYRYFVLFLMWLWAACLYGVLLLLSPFIALMTNARQFSPVGGIASERSAVLFTFVLALSVGIALSALLGWHVYLIFTAQTTIEFYVNKARREKARHRGQLYINPYDLGWVRNWESVFGKMPWYMAVLPSRRPPPDMSFEAETAMLMGRDFASVV